MEYVIELCYYTLEHQSREIDLLLLDLCSESFVAYSKITMVFETWGYQFMKKNNAYKKRVRNLLEDCETSMVNGEKCLINYNTQK